MKKIIDVSKYQDPIDYFEVAKQCDGVILRAGFTGWGTANQCNPDPSFEKHYNGFAATGIHIGAYYYSAADTIQKAIEEADFFKSLLSGKKFDLPVYYDVEEENRMGYLSKDQLTDQVIAFCDRMECDGYFVGVYANTNYFLNKLHANKLSEKYTIWLADYRTNFNTTLPRDMHQYTSTAIVNGIRGGVDMNNLFRVNLPDIIKSSGKNGYEQQEIPNVELYDVTFGPCSTGDRGTAVVLGQNLGVETYESEKDGLYYVHYAPMTLGDVRAVQNLGNQLIVPVTVK